MKNVILIFLFVGILSLSAFYFLRLDKDILEPKYAGGSWRYKLTVVIDTPEGEKSGSAVREVSVNMTPSILTSKMISARARVAGEAVVVDLGEYGYVFALMDTDGSYSIVYEAFRTKYAPHTAEGISYYSRLYKVNGPQKVKVTPPMRNLPRLVYFKDVLLPKTVTPLNRNALSEDFGAGVSLKGIYIEMTEEPVTQKIQEILPWLKEIKGGYLDGQYAGGGPDLSNILHGGNFIRRTMFSD